MITELILTVIMGVSSFIVSALFDLLGGLVSIDEAWRVGLIELIEKGLYFFPQDVFVAVIGYYTFWFTVKMSWGLIQFAIKKIPGIS